MSLLRYIRDNQQLPDGTYFITWKQLVGMAIRFRWANRLAMKYWEYAHRFMFHRKRNSEYHKVKRFVWERKGK